jgi:hypothetical protein
MKWLAMEMEMEMEMWAELHARVVASVNVF